MVESGRALQEWLSIPADRVEWVVGDVMDATPAGMDFVYLYRPVRPDGPGRAFYERFAAEVDRGAVIFSIADCLSEFLPEEFAAFYSDGHLTCYHRGGGSIVMPDLIPEYREKEWRLEKWRNRPALLHRDW